MKKNAKGQVIDIEYKNYNLLKNESEKNEKNYNYINYPFLNAEAFKKTMNNYRQFVHEYNKGSENKKITSYNKKAENNIPHNILTDIIAFKKKNKNLLLHEYNEEVEKFNIKLKSIYLKKREITTIKYNTELVFSILLGFYGSQLNEKNKSLLKSNITTRVLKNSLPKLVIDSRKLATHKIGGIQRIDFCKKTAQNHIKRLREGKVLINYKFINRNTPISVNINPKILVIFDKNPPKQQITINKEFSQSKRKELHNNIDSINIKNLKKIKNNDNVKSIVNKFYKVTTAIDKEKERQEIKNILPSFLKEGEPKKTKGDLLAENFLKKLECPKKLAHDLANGLYHKYKPLRYDYLEKIILYAPVSNDEFKKIIIQDFIKTASKIWQSHDVYIGEWLKTIKYLERKLFSTITQKENILNKLREYRWKINFARNWFKITKVNALYPYAYFDITRIQKNEIGFFGLHRNWLKHLKKKEKEFKEDKKRVQESNARKRKKNAKNKKTDEK